MNMEALEKTCPHCGRVIKSLYESQLEYNYTQHVEACEKKKLKSVEKEILKK